MFSPGDIIGPYRIEREIGRGGMAVVYLARHQRLERPVALKVLREQFLQDKELVERFLYEARAAARLDHANIVAIHDAGQIDGRDYIAMEYIEGESLAEILGRVAGPLPLNFTLSIAKQVAAALDYAHRRGVVHRDIKPSNILVRENGHALLADFGIARAASLSSLTNAGTILGTPEYMSPEQAEGKDVDGRSDVYSLAILAYCMLTGRTPYKGDTPHSILFAHVNQELPDPRQYNPDLSPASISVLRTGAAKNPERRYPTAGAFSQALWAAAQPHLTPASISSAKPARRANLAGWAIIGVLLVVAAIAFGAWAMQRDQEPPPPTPTATTIVAGIAPTNTAISIIPNTHTPTSTATPSPTPTHTATATATATPTPSPTPSPIPTVVLAPRIVYVSDRSGAPQIYLINSDGSDDLQLTFEGRNDRPFWSSAGDVIFFTSDRGRGPALWSMRPDGTAKTELLYVPNAILYSISPDGQHTVYVRAVDGAVNLILDGQLWARLPGDRIDFQWSPDSSHILFESVTGPRILQTLSITSDTPAPLTEQSYSSWNPTWSPDSRRIAFASTRDGNAGIYTMFLDGSNVLRLTPLDQWNQIPVWSPDGGGISHIGSEAGTWSLYLMREDGSGRFALHTPVFPDAAAAWSSDSNRLAFSISDGDPELAAINRDGGQFVQLTNNDANDWNPVWEPLR